MDRVPYVNLAAQWTDEKHQLLPIVEAVLGSGQYIGGDEVAAFEHQAAIAFDVKHVVALNSGTDALACGLIAVGVRPGDEVITPPNSFIASTAAIVHIGARPVFVDVGLDQNIDPMLIEDAITKKTKALMAVHFAGRMADMKAISDIAMKRNLAVIEDAAQSAGSLLDNRSSGSWGKVGCFSAHPLKNLNACGDAGFITTNDESIASQIRLARNHGLVDRDTVQCFGFVSRMDTLQAAVLRFRLLKLASVVERRRINVELYRSILNPQVVYCPPERSREFNTWHTFVIQVDKRDELKLFLASRGIETAIHYPTPIHLQQAARYLGHQQGDFPVTENLTERILTLPIHQHLSFDQIRLVGESINEFFGV